jgi:uncharacterized protein (DUF362 family)
MKNLQTRNNNLLISLESLQKYTANILVPSAFHPTSIHLPTNTLMHSPTHAFTHPCNSCKVYSAVCGVMKDENIFPFLLFSPADAVDPTPVGGGASRIQRDARMLH